MIALPGITIQDTIYESVHSIVYRGTRDNGLAIVIKRLKEEYPSPQALTRYRQEYAITRSLNLKGVVKAYSQQDYQRTLVMLLEDFGGESLEHWMRQQPDFCPMSLTPFLQLAIDLTDILGKIHAANIIHKDINPGNIVLNLDTGVVKIIDFGIATQFNRTNPTFKSPHVLEGTLPYLSPEQTGRMNRAIDYRTDFYSLGVTFYQLLTGQLPFLTTDVLEVVHCHIAKQPTPPHEFNGAIPEAVSAIILKLMAKNAEDRYQSAWGIKADLEQCAEQLAASGQINDIQLGLQDVSDQFQIPQRLYGRDAEIAALLAAFERVAGGDDAKRGRRGETESNNVPASSHPRVSASAEMMLVSGYSGIGKSALVQELYKPITAKRGYFISGKFDQLQRNIPYSAIVDALRKLVQQLLGEPDDRVQQWRSRLLTALGSNGQLIIDVIPAVELIVGKQPLIPEVGATEAQNRFNLVFQKFIRVFCSKKHPLVIFLDDLQWIDFATLKLIELMLLDEQTQFLFLIGAYRDHEVSPSHPLVLTLEGLPKQGAVLHQIVLSPLTLEPLSKLVAEALHRDARTVLPLAELVLRKTGGNPFLVGEVLRLLYSEDLLRFDADRLSWRWNLDQIRALNITDNVNVVELLLNKLRKLPEVTQQLLQLAACIGAEFDLETLAIVCEQSPKAVFQGLLTAIQAGLIQPLSELDEDLLVQDYKFLHDRVQQAAYALINKERLQFVHLQIGYLLLESNEPETSSSALFKVVDHLNFGRDLVTNQQERDKIARLNLISGQRAKKSTAYAAASKYIAVGIQLLKEDCWQHQYDLALALYEEATELAYLNGDFKQLEQKSEIVLQQARSLLDKVKVSIAKIQGHGAQQNLRKALDTALMILDQFGVCFLPKPCQNDITQALAETRILWQDKSPLSLLELPVMTAAESLAAMQLLSGVIPIAYQVAPESLVLIVLKQVNLSIKYGNTALSSHAYACYGFILCGMVGDIEAGFEFGSLSLSLLNTFADKEIKAKALYVVNAIVTPWKRSINSTREPLLKAYIMALEIGDLSHAAWAAYMYGYHSYFTGQELTKLEREMASYSQKLHQLKQESLMQLNQICHQAILNLLGHVEHPCDLVGDAYDEQIMLPLHQKNDNHTLIFRCYFQKLILCYLFENDEAVKNANLAEVYLNGVVGYLDIPLFHFYDSLARLSKFTCATESEQDSILNRVSASQAKMVNWAHHAPMNYLHKWYLVEAEKARVLGQFFEAEELYEQAMQGARDNEYLQEEALAYELAAKHYLVRGRAKIAQTYMKEARYCYERWGATAKVKDLETRYPQLFPPSSAVAHTPISTISGTTSNTSHIAFDLAAVMKASQAISSEIELERLLSSLMQILIENAGAQSGCLLLENSGEWAIEAACELNEGKKVCATQVLQSIPTVNRIPESIIQYVIRTHESVILSNATREGNFSNDPYIQQHQTQSLLCLPLLNQSKLVGVLYLENQLAVGAFTPERSQVLHLLSSQAAIAIENAKLYSKLRASESQMTQFLDAIPVGIGIIDAVGRPYYANQRGIQLMGKGIDPTVPSDQISEVYQFYVTGTDQVYPSENLPIIRALSGERITVDGIDIRQNDKTVPVEVWGTPVFDEQGNVVYAIAAFQDITERKQAEYLLANYNRTLEQQVAERTAALQQSEAELRHQEQELRLITDALPALISYVDANQCYQFINRTYELWFNRSRDEILGNSVHALLGETVYQQVESSINQVFEGQIVTLETEILSAVGKRCISITFIPDFDAKAQVRGFYSLITDISDRKRAEHASILEERNRMAREIHDTLAQSFTGILLQVGAATQLLTDDLEASQEHLEMLEMIDELARTGLAEARRSVAALRPQLLEEGNLPNALRRFVTQMGSTIEPTLIYESKGTAYPLPTEVENHLLRMGQEALTNAIKYAEADEIRVELVYEPAQCFLRIQDDGRGFNIGSVSSTGGFGLLGMSERAEQIDAHLTIQSQPGQGTEILVVVKRG